MSEAPTYELKVDQGDTLSFRLRHLAAEVPVIWDGYSARIEIKFQGQTLELTSPDEVQLEDDGYLSFKVDSETTANWPRGRSGYYRVRVVDSAGDVATILKGFVHVG